MLYVGWTLCVLLQHVFISWLMVFGVSACLLEPLGSNNCFRKPDRSYFYPDPKNFVDFVLGPKFLGFNFQLLPHHASCPDHLSTKITEHVEAK